MGHSHPAGPSVRHRTLFLSDLHLGAIGARADRLLAFLHENPAATYVLVGDILDLWYPLLPHWAAAQQQVIDHLAARHAAGATLLYVRGNHDPDPDSAPAGRRLPVPAQVTAEHLAGDGRRYLVIHGDAQDSRVLSSLFLRRIGSRIDNGLRSMDLALRRWRGRDHGQHSRIERLIAGFNAWLYRGRAYERRLITLAREGGYDGVICGHFHLPALHSDHGLVYANCGDWVDSLTALTEDFAGRIQLLDLRAEELPAGAAKPAALAPQGV